MTMTIMPDLMTMLDGSPVTSPDQWPERRAELLDVLGRELYGVMPPAPAAVRGDVDAVDPTCCAGHARLEKLRLSFDTPSGPFTFPAQFLYPATGGPHPLVIHLSFATEATGWSCPAEEIIDRGYALAHIRYTDVTSDDADMTSGLAGRYPREGGTAWGKLAMWAWAASRAADYFLTRPEIDGANLAVIGHSRLGKAALVCGAWDERFRFVIANDSGCGGAALDQRARPDAENYARMHVSFPYWGCDNWRNHLDPAQPRPFDQHMLLAAVAPRHVIAGSAAADLWADPLAEQQGCMAASPAWALHGLPGYVGPEEPARSGEAYHDGRIGYHLRDGVHYLSRRDWLSYLAFMDRHRA